MGNGVCIVKVPRAATEASDIVYHHETKGPISLTFRNHGGNWNLHSMDDGGKVLVVWCDDA